MSNVVEDVVVGVIGPVVVDVLGSGDLPILKPVIGWTGDESCPILEE